MRGNASHWKIVEDTRVKRVVRNAAQSIGNMNAGVVEVEDLFQEGLLIVAGTPKIAEHAVAGDAGMLYKEVRERLYKAFVRPLDRSGELDARKYKTVTPEDAEASESAASYVTFDDGSGDYNADAVRLLLPAVWDESYAYSLPEPDNAPEQGMPRAAANKSTRNSHWAYIADIKTGWEKTPLTFDERRAIFMRFGLAWTQGDIAFHERVDQSTVSRRINTAISKIVARLNGAQISEEE